jgi:hypothetical protein
MQMMISIKKIFSYESKYAQRSLIDAQTLQSFQTSGILHRLAQITNVLIYNQLFMIHDMLRSLLPASQSIYIIGLRSAISNLHYYNDMATLRI